MFKLHHSQKTKLKTEYCVAVINSSTAYLSRHELSKSFRKRYCSNNEDDDGWIHETAVDRNHSSWKCRYSIIIFTWLIEQMVQLISWQLLLVLNYKATKTQQLFNHTLNIIQFLLHWQKLCHLSVFVSSLNINQLSMSEYKQCPTKATKQPAKDQITIQFNGSVK